MAIMDVLLIPSIAVILCVAVTSLKLLEHLPEIRNKREQVVHSVSRQIPKGVLYNDDDDDDDDDNHIPEGRRSVGWHSGGYSLLESRARMYSFYICIREVSVVIGIACRLDTQSLRKDVQGTVQSILNKCSAETADCLWKSWYIRCSRRNCVYVCSLLNANRGRQQHRTALKRKRVRRSGVQPCGAMCQLLGCVGRQGVLNQYFLQCILSIKLTSPIFTEGPPIPRVAISSVFSTPSTPPLPSSVTFPPAVNSSTAPNTTVIDDTGSRRSKTLIAGVIAGLVILIIIIVIAALVWIKYRCRRRSRCAITSRIKRGRRESQLAYSHLHEPRTIVTRQISSRPSHEYSLPDLLETIPYHHPGSDDTEYNHLGDVLKPTSGSGNIYNKTTTAHLRYIVTDESYEKLRAEETGLRFIKAYRDKGDNSSTTNSVYYDALRGFESEGERVMYFTVEPSSDVYAEIADVAKRRSSVIKHVYFTLEETPRADYDRQQNE